MRVRATIACLAALMAVAALPPVASASGSRDSFQSRQIRLLMAKAAARKAGGGHPSTRVHPRFALGADGYWVTVDGYGAAVAVDVSREHRHSDSSSGYLVHGTGSGGRLVARFGKLGRVDMRFLPRGRLSVPAHPRCRGFHRFGVRHGVWVGNFRFRGEGGYVSVVAHRAEGSVREVIPACRSGRALARASGSRVPHTESVEQRPERAYLLASRREGVGYTSLIALRGKKHRTVLFADHETTSAKMTILRVAAVDAPAAALRTDETLTSARVAAPWPFHGVGVYAASPDGTRSWSGTLVADYPGLARVPLTGSDFEVGAGRSSDPLLLLFLLLIA